MLGHVAISQIRRDHTDGRGMAIGGRVLGWTLTSRRIIYWILVLAGAIAGIGGIGSNAAGDPALGRSRLTVNETTDGV
ncbi:DUF4190 domain-containing protein [Microbispora sitophila]|uniref:DUF4190 domain-containing protein n=1 Tax=Microbispora sitophila TaxID=2771537 RepID=UPI00299F5F58|nr:DUF4190 domain-containing protein [Microbispora sitophila]